MSYRTQLLQVTLVAVSLAVGMQAQDQINFVDDQIAFEFVGQVTNFPPTPAAPLGSSNQYGYLTVVRGIDSVFSGSPHDETTAVLTFFNDATTTESVSDGPLRIIDRNGTTTIYLNSAAASFTNPDSFRSGIPVQTSSLHQQAIVDTWIAISALGAEKTFTLAPAASEEFALNYAMGNISFIAPDQLATVRRAA